MKRVLLPLAVVILALTGAGIYLQRHVFPHARQVAAWLPADAILFEDMPDLHRTAERWPSTALAQIIAEPEVRAIIDPLLSRRAPTMSELDQRFAEVRADRSGTFLPCRRRLEPVPGRPKPSPGLSYAGSRENLDAARR